MIWSSPSFKGLFLPKGKLSSLVFNFNLPGTFSEIAHKPIVLSLNIIGRQVQPSYLQLSLRY